MKLLIGALLLVSMQPAMAYDAALCEGIERIPPRLNSEFEKRVKLMTARFISNNADALLAECGSIFDPQFDECSNSYMMGNSFLNAEVERVSETYETTIGVLAVLSAEEGCP